MTTAAGRRNARPAAAAGSAACARMAARLWPYLDGELTPAQGAALCRHLAACPACERAARQLRGLLDACRAAGCGPLPKDVAAGAARRARAVVGTTPAPRTRARR